MDERTFTVPWLLARVAKAAGPVILDVGCSGSTYGMNLPPHIGIDPRGLKPTGLAHQVFKAISAESVDMPDGSVDVIVLHRVLEFIGTGAFGLKAGDHVLEKALTNLIRLLKDGGTMIATVAVGVSDVIASVSGPVRILSLRDAKTLFKSLQAQDTRYWIQSKGVFTTAEEDDVHGHTWESDHPTAVMGMCLLKLKPGDPIPDLEITAFKPPQLIQQAAWNSQIRKAASLMQGTPEKWGEEG